MAVIQFQILAVEWKESGLEGGGATTAQRTNKHAELKLTNQLTKPNINKP